MEQYLFVFLIAIGASFLQTTIGFGFAVFSMIFLHKIYPYGEAIAMCQALVTLNTVYLAVRHYKYIQFRIMIPLLIPSLTFGIIFTLFSYSINIQFLKSLLGLVLILLSLYMIRYPNQIHLKPTKKNGVIAGSITGIGNGLFGIAGPPAVLYFLTASSNKFVFLATTQAFFSFNNLTNLTTRFLKGDLQTSNTFHIFSGWVGIFIGMSLGLFAFKFLRINLLKKSIYAFVGVNGLWIIIQELVM